MSHKQYPQFTLGEVFAEVPVQRTVPDITSRNAFGRVPFPQYWGVADDKYISVTPEHEAAVDPNLLAERLGNRDSQYAINGIVLSPEEYATIPTHVPTFAGRVSARTTAARAHLETATEQDVPANERSVAHAFRSKIPVLENLEAQYDAEIRNLGWLRTEIPHHWLAHGREMNMRSVAASARNSFDNIVETVAASEGWTKDDLKAALLALEKRLLFGALEVKKSEWATRARHAEIYALGKRGLVRNKRFELERRIARTGLAS
jgi:hypothetical protein